MIQKNGIILRAIEEKDLPVLQSWRNDDNLRRYFREWRDFSLKQKKKWYDQMIFDDRFQMFPTLFKFLGHLFGNPITLAPENTP